MKRKGANGYKRVCALGAEAKSPVATPVRR
jgi:hypothetical protein